MNSSPTYSPVAVVPSAPETLSPTRRALQIVAASLVVTLAAHIAFPLPFTPVPFTLQPLAVLGVGLFLGPVDGAFALIAYLAEGAAGLPVFSPTGPGGLLQLLGPTGGYLLSYPLIALLAGCSRRFADLLGPFLAALLGCLVAIVILFTVGASWLAHFAHLGAHAVWIAAIAPFLPGEVVKAFVAAGTFRATHSHMRAR